MERKTKSKSKKENKKKDRTWRPQKNEREMAVGLKDYFGLVAVSVFLKAVRAGFVFM